MTSRIAPLLLLAVIACNKPENKDQPTTTTTASTAAATTSAAPATAPPSASGAVVAIAIPPEATKMFNERCSLCHGKEGKGDGIGGKGMKPPPRDWTDAKWQSTVTDEQISTTFVKGGAAVGKSPTMPPSPDLEGPAQAKTVEGLVHLVRSFNKP